VRQSVQTVSIATSIAAAIIVMAGAARQDASAALHAFPSQPISYVFSAQLTSYEAPVQTISYGVSSQLKSYLDPSQLTSFGDPQPQTPLPEPQQIAPMGHSRKPMSDGSSRQLRVPIVRIEFNAPALAPMSHTIFCLKYQNDCRVHKTVFRGGALKLTAERWAELKRINTEVNRAIVPERNMEGLAGEKWLISPKSGDCNDYAVTKRHELLTHGWPARVLLLSEVVVSSGEHHLVLVVRTSDGDFVADNLNANIRPWSKTHYQWVRIQSPANPMFWSTVARTTVWANRTLLADVES